MPNFEKVQHRLFGPGFVFSQRELGVGPVLDVWFIRDEKTRTVLAEEQYWTEPLGESLEFSKQKLRTAYNSWKRLHTRPLSEIVFARSKSEQDTLETPEVYPQNGREALADEGEELVVQAGD
jgi:hypothetical protein